jgi:glycosyltransferase involved in cell wall biosynthesis
MLRLALLTTDNREDRRDYSPELPWFGTAPQSLLDGFAHCPEEIEVHVISCARRHLKSDLQLAANVFFHSVYVPHWAWLKSGYLGNLLAVRRCLTQIHPDIVHGQGTERDCALTAAFSGYPNLITIHGNMRRLARISHAPLWSFAGISAVLENIALRWCGGVVSLSSHSHDLAAPLARRAWLVPNAVDPSFFSVVRNPSARPPVILIVADLLPNKNILRFLESIAPFRESCPFTVRLIGKAQQDSPYVRAIHSFADGHSWCGIEPFADRERIRAAMASATLLALPSIEENLPMVILEAMAAGLPVAASCVGGIPDLITDRYTGMLFNPGCPASICGAIRHLLDHPLERAQMAEAAQKKALQSHHPAVVAHAHLEIYRSMLPAGA